MDGSLVHWDSPWDLAIVRPTRCQLLHQQRLQQYCQCNLVRTIIIWPIRLTIHNWNRLSEYDGLIKCFIINYGDCYKDRKRVGSNDDEQWRASQEILIRVFPLLLISTFCRFKKFLFTMHMNRNVPQVQCWLCAVKLSGVTHVILTTSVESGVPEIVSFHG